MRGSNILGALSLQQRNRTLMDQYRYARQKLWEALYALVGSGSIKDRLGYAYSSLGILQPDKDHPLELRGQFQNLMTDLERRIVHYSYRPSRINTRHRKADQMAESILSLYIALRGGI